MSGHIQIQSHLSELARVSDWLQDTASSYGIAQREVFNLELVLEEAITNIIRHAFDDEQDQVIEVHFSFEEGEVVIRIEDSGKEFDPLKAPEPTLPTDIEEAKIGGLGIHLMRNLLDDMAYEREGGKNILTLRKDVKGEGNK